MSFLLPRENNGKARSLFIVSHGFETSQTAVLDSLFVVRGLPPPTGLRVLIPCAMAGAYEARSAPYIKLIVYFEKEKNIMTENERILELKLLETAFIDLSNVKTVKTEKIKNAIVSQVRRTIIKLNDYDRYDTEPEFLIRGMRRFLYEDAESVLIFGFQNLQLFNDEEYDYIHAKLRQAFDSEEYKIDKRTIKEVHEND